LLFLKRKRPTEVKIALTVWRERISPLFEAARLLLIADIADKKVIAREVHPLHPESPHCRAARLSRMGVDTLICGAVSLPQATLLEAYGIRVLADVTGRAEAVLAAFLNDRLSDHLHIGDHQSGKKS
jgi:predicted Fe-Mo cluster-binding NifX family protein